MFYTSRTRSLFHFDVYHSVFNDCFSPYTYLYWHHVNHKWVNLISAADTRGPWLVIHAKVYLCLILVCFAHCRHFNHQWVNMMSREQVEYDWLFTSIYMYVCMYDIYIFVFLHCVSCRIGLIWRIKRGKSEAVVIEWQNKMTENRNNVSWVYCSCACVCVGEREYVCVSWRYRRMVVLLFVSFTLFQTMGH